MSANDLESPQTSADVRYPIGKFHAPETISSQDRAGWLSTLADLPGKLRAATKGWSEEKLNTPYRESGWTVLQLLHHIADSHMNAYCRVKLALTEDWPTISAYDEAKWAELRDAKTAPAEWSLAMIEPLHARWVMLLRSVREEEWRRGYKHPVMGPMTVEQVLSLYAWHSQHHLEHITRLSQRKGW